MLALILLIIFSLGVAYFATENTGVVHIMFGNYLLQNIPLYVIVIGALLLGVVVSLLISLVDRLSTTVTVHGKDSEIAKMQKSLYEVKQEKDRLELENRKLQEDYEDVLSSGRRMETATAENMRHAIS